MSCPDNNIEEDKTKIDYKLQKRMKEFDIALKKQEQNPEYLYEEVKSIDIVIRFEIFLTPPQDDIGLVDGLYIYMNENGMIVDAEYYIKENGELTILRLKDEELEIVRDLFRDTFAVDVD